MASTILDILPAPPEGGTSHSVGSAGIAFPGIGASTIGSTHIVACAVTCATPCIIPCLTTDVATDVATCNVSGIITRTLASSIVAIACICATAVSHIRIFCNAAIATATWIGHTTGRRTVGPFALTISPQTPGLLLVSTLLGASAFPPEVARGLA